MIDLIQKWNRTYIFFGFVRGRWISWGWVSSGRINWSLVSRSRIRRSWVSRIGNGNRDDCGKDEELWNPMSFSKRSHIQPYDIIPSCLRVVKGLRQLDNWCFFTVDARTYILWNYLIFLEQWTYLKSWNVLSQESKDNWKRESFFLCTRQVFFSRAISPHYSLVIS